MRLFSSPQLTKLVRLIGIGLAIFLLTIGWGFCNSNLLSLYNPATAATPATDTLAQSPSQNLTLAQTEDGHRYLQQGRDYYAAAQFSAAARVWEQADKYFATQADNLNRAIASSNLALAYQQLGQWAEAETAISNSLRLIGATDAISPQGLRIYGQALNTQGSLSFAQGDNEQALATWEQATEIYRRADYLKGIVKSLINQTYALRSLGFFRESRSRLLQADQLIKDLDNSPLKLTLTRSLGETQRLIGDLQASETLLQQSLDIAESLALPTEIATTRFSLGNTLQASAQQQEILAQRTRQPMDRAEAEQQYEQAIATYAAVPDSAPSILWTKAQLNQLDIQLRLKRWDAARFQYLRLSEGLEELPSGRPAIFAYLQLAQILLDKCPDACATQLQISKPQQVYALLSAAKHQAEMLNDSTAESYALGYLGHLYEETARYPDAQQFTEAALNIAKNQPSPAYKWQWQLGRLAEKQQKNRNEVLMYYDAAFQNVRTVRSDLLYMDSDVKFDFRDQVEPLYREYISLLLPEEEASIQGDATLLVQAQTVIDDLRVAELESFLACGLVEPNRDISLATIQAVAKADQTTAIISPIILPNQNGNDRLEVLLQLPNQAIKRYYPPTKVLPSVPNDQPQTIFDSSLSAVQFTLESFRKELEQPYFSTERGFPLAEEIYDWLIRPAEEQGWLTSIDTLIFVLDGPFRRVPMAALHDRQTQNFLVEKYAIAVAFGDLQLPATAPDRSFQVLAVGLTEDPNPLFGSPSKSDSDSEGRIKFDTFGPLAYVEEEIQAISSNIDNTTVLLNQDFTREQVRANMSSSAYNIVHFATHGEFGFSRENTFLLAAVPDVLPQSDSGIPAEGIDLNSFDDLLRTRNRTPLELLVLSACETATGDNREVLGIAGLAIQSGARSTLATLWSISDPSTAVLMETFYKNLAHQDVSKAQALQKAQVELIARGYKPNRWAPYLLAGDWR